MTTTTTRAERQAQTRRRLLDVAREAFLRDGYAATSLDKVALEAGFSKGAVYSNFDGKEQLCLAVLDDIHAEKIAAVLAALASAPTLDDKLRAFGRWADTGLGDPGWTALEAEFGAVARHNEWVATQLVRRHRVIRQAIANLVDDLLSEAGLSAEMPADDVATALLALGTGLGALRSLDSTIDPAVFTAIARALLRSLR